MNCENEDCGVAADAEVNLSLADRWIISKLQETEDSVAKAVAHYRFDHASQALYEFVWNEYCDWYLELSKPVLWDDNATEAAKRGTRRTLIRVLETCLRLLHPFTPFITEEIWQTVGPLAGKSGDTIMLQPYPVSDHKAIDKAANADIEWLKHVIVGIRNIRGEMNISPATELTILLKNGSEQDKTRLEANRQFLTKLAKLSKISWLEASEEAPVAATALVGDLEILVPMAGLIDKEAELARLAKEADKLEKELARLKGKLNNASFIEKAPAEVVAREREKMQALEQALSKLRDQEQRIKNL